MERLQGPINPCFFGEHLEANCLQQDFVDIESLRLLEEEQFLTQSLEEKMPFLQMLQSAESPQIFPFKEPNFQTLLKLQHLRKPWEGKTCMPRMDPQIRHLELENHEVVERMRSLVKSESNKFQNPQYSASCVEGVVSECNQEQAILAENLSSQSGPKETQKCLKSQFVVRERRKRKRTRPIKNKEDVENQRMTHIAVERNRRRLMNDHLNVLKSLMPPPYIQRGDQASIIGGAIDFVKQLEQLVQSLEAQKMMRRNEENGSSGLFKAPPQSHEMKPTADEAGCGDDLKAENKSDAADIEVTLIQTHVNLKIQCQRRSGQLIKAIVAFEDLNLTILHLNITSSQTSVIYSFNLKIEEDCKLGSANEIAEAVRHIFSFINGS